MAFQIAIILCCCIWVQRSLIVNQQEFRNESAMSHFFMSQQLRIPPRVEGGTSFSATAKKISDFLMPGKPFLCPGSADCNNQIAATHTCVTLLKPLILF